MEKITDYEKKHGNPKGFNNFMFLIKIVFLTLKQNSIAFSTLCSQK